MIAPEHARLMARYNRWQNRSLYTAASGLTDAERRLDRGAFFGSIHGTLAHLMWGDATWMHRFTGSEKPGGTGREPTLLHAPWAELDAARQALDAAIIAWTDGLDQAWLDASTTWYSGVMQSDCTRANWLLATHFFNHQTHHRGQTHAMLTAAGARPEDTDLVFMQESYGA